LGGFAAALQRAHELSEEMVPQRAVVTDLAEQANIPLTTRREPRSIAPVELPVALTARGREILRHVVAWRTTAQIGQDLFIGDNTVSVHITHLLRKIVVTTRVQAAARLAAWAEQVGFTDPPEPSP
jgi:DNA-binding CsgD family transcriptional regulator